MNSRFAPLHRALLSAALVLPLALPLSARAAPVSLDVLLNGAGTLNFTSGTSAGFWFGMLTDEGFAPLPPLLAPLSSQVSFTLSGSTVTGMFAFSTDPNNILSGQIDGVLTQGSFADAGQLELEYTVDSGTGQFAGATGFLISLLDFEAPVRGNSAYKEVATGVLVVQAVPEPGGLALAGVALLALVTSRRKVAPVN